MFLIYQYLSFFVVVLVKSMQIICKFLETKSALMISKTHIIRIFEK